MTPFGTVFTCFRLGEDIVMCGTMAGTIQVYDLVSGARVTNFHLVCGSNLTQSPLF